MGKIVHIAIDGPSGAGKSTIAKRVAKALNVLYLDTGAMYRAIGLKALKGQIDREDEAQLSKMMESTTLDIRFEENEQRVYLDGVDISLEVRTPDVSKAASDVSRWPSVRLNMVEQQRAIAKSKSLVMDGRDIGTYVLPDAQYKFFMTASSKVRATRRYLQLKEVGKEKPLDEIENEIIARDKQDMERDFAPLCQAKDAHYLDTSDLSINQVVDKMLEVIGR